MLSAKIKYKKLGESILSEENSLPINGNFIVSLQLGIIKFLLIYRYLQNAYWFKRGESTCCPFHSLRLSHWLCVAK